MTGETNTTDAQTSNAGHGPVDRRVRRRWQIPKAKPGELLMRWGKEPGGRPEMCMAWGEGTSKRDANLVHYWLASKHPDPSAVPIFSKMLPSLLEDLEARGYDLTTLQFSVRKKQGA